MGMQPDFWKPFDEEVPSATALTQFLPGSPCLSGKRPHLVTLYFEEPDAVSHVYGPVSPETGDVVRSLDSLIGVLRDRTAADCLRQKK